MRSAAPEGFRGRGLIPRPGSEGQAVAAADSLPRPRHSQRPHGHPAWDALLGGAHEGACAGARVRVSVKINKAKGKHVCRWTRTQGNVSEAQAGGGDDVNTFFSVLKRTSLSAAAICARSTQAPLGEGRGRRFLLLPDRRLLPNRDAPTPGSVSTGAPFSEYPSGGSWTCQEPRSLRDSILPSFKYPCPQTFLWPRL